MGAPPSVRYCLGRAPPMRAPTPPAGTTATALVIGCGSPEMAPALPRLRASPRPFGARRSCGRARSLVLCVLLSSRHPVVFLEAGEDHAAGCGLENRGDRGADLLADQPLAVVDVHHRAVVEVANNIANFLALLDDVDVDDLAGQH